MIIRTGIALSVAIAAAALGAHFATAKSGGDLVKVSRDVDVYAQPGGEGEPIGMLRKNSQVELINEKDQWCNVQGVAVPAPGNFGWVWCGIGDDGKDYSLKPVVAEKPAGPQNPPTEPVKSDCKIIGPNEEAGGGSSDPKVTYKCVDKGDGTKECCFYTQP